MVHTTTQNEKLMKILSDRPSIMQDLIDYNDLDDEQIRQYNKWLHWYNHLSQFDRDIFYLYTIGYTGYDIAKLYDCSQSLIYSKLKRIKSTL